MLLRCRAYSDRLAWLAASLAMLLSSVARCFSSISLQIWDRTSAALTPLRLGNFLPTASSSSVESCSLSDGSEVACVESRMCVFARRWTVIETVPSRRRGSCSSSCSRRRLVRCTLVGLASVVPPDGLLRRRVADWTASGLASGLVSMVCVVSGPGRGSCPLPRDGRPLRRELSPFSCGCCFLLALSSCNF